jgi:hypothetical protein
MKDLRGYSSIAYHEGSTYPKTSSRMGRIPGHVTMKRGLVDFYNKMDGFDTLSRYLGENDMRKVDAEDMNHYYI